MNPQLTPPLPPDFHEGQHLRDYLRYHHISQLELARRLGMSNANVGWLVKAQVIPLKHRAALLKALGVTYQAFIQPLSIPPGGQGQQLKNYLKAHQLTAKWLAAQLGITGPSVSDYFQVQTFGLATRQTLLRVVGASDEQVFPPQPSKALTPPLEPPPSVAPAPPVPGEQAPDALSLIRRQLGEWQALAQRLAAESAPAAHRSFCQYQIWHLELSLPALGLSTPLSGGADANPKITPQPDDRLTD